MTEKEITQISNSLEIIFLSLREGLIENIKNMDLITYTNFNFEKDILELRLPAAEMNIDLKVILENLKKINK